MPRPHACGKYWYADVPSATIAERGERGSGLAIAGIIVGVVTLVFAIGYWAFLAMHTGGTGGGSGGGTGGGY